MILNFYIPAEVCDEIERETCVFLKVPDCKEDFIEECIKTITNECNPQCTPNFWCKMCTGDPLPPPPIPNSLS